MADITTSTIGGELIAEQDYVFEGQAIPQNTSVVSSVIKSGKTQAALEYVIEMATTGDLAVGTVITIEYGYGDTDAGTYTDKVTVYSFTGTAAANELPAGELIRFVPTSDMGPYGEFTVTTDDAAATGTFTIYPRYTKQ